MRTDRPAAFAVNGTALATWRAFAEGATVDEAAAVLAEAFGADPAVVAADVRRVLPPLVDAGFLVPSPPGPDADRPEHDADRPEHDADRPEPDPAGEVPRHGCRGDEPRGRTPVAHDDHWHLPLAESGCLHKLDRLGWATTVALRVGRFAVGVRCDTAETAVLLRHLLPHLAVDDPAAPPGWSLVLGPPTVEFPRRGLFEGHTWVSRSEHPGDVLATLLARLEGLLPWPPGAVRIAAVAVTAGDGDGDGVRLVPAPRGAPLSGWEAWRAAGPVRPSPVVVVPGPGAGTGPELLPPDAALQPDPGVAARVGLSPPPVTARPVRALARPDLGTGTTAERFVALVAILEPGPDDDAGPDVVARLAALAAALPDEVLAW